MANTRRKRRCLSEDLNSGVVRHFPFGPGPKDQGAMITFRPARFRGFRRRSDPSCDGLGLSLEPARVCQDPSSNRRFVRTRVSAARTSKVITAIPHAETVGIPAGHASSHVAPSPLYFDLLGPAHKVAVVCVHPCEVQQPRTHQERRQASRGIRTPSRSSPRCYRPTSHR
jgi:hypothetical protein